MHAARRPKSRMRDFRSRAVRARALRAVAIGAVAVAVSFAPASAAGGSGDLPGGVLVLSCGLCPGSPEEVALYSLLPRGTLRMIPGTRDARKPAWSPDGRRVAFARSELWVTRLDGTVSRRLTAPYPAPNVGGSDWSPDGRTIVFVRYAPSPVGGYRGSLWRIPATGGRPTLIHAPRYSANDPSWSPDGRRIAYGDVRQRLWVVSVDGTGQRTLGPLDVRGAKPRWSPDGSRIAFIQCGTALTLSVLDLRTSRVRRVFRLDPSNSQAFDLAWSPDGRWLALARQREYVCAELAPRELCVDFDVLAIRLRDRARRLLYTADVGASDGLDWRS